MATTKIKRKTAAYKRFCDQLEHRFAKISEIGRIDQRVPCSCVCERQGTDIDFHFSADGADRLAPALFFLRLRFAGDLAINLAGMSALPRGQGYGDIVLRELCACADAARLPIWIHSRPEGESFEQRAIWLNRLGFVEEGGGSHRMTRQPGGWLAGTLADGFRFFRCLVRCRAA